MRVNISVGLDIETANRVRLEAHKAGKAVSKYVTDLVNAHIDALEGADARRDLAKQHAASGELQSGS